MIYLRVLVCSLLVSLFISCTTNIKNYGYIPTKSELDTLVIGKDSKESVSKKVGRPATEGLEGSFYYVRSTFNESGLRSAQLIDRTVVLLSFDKRNLLKNVETFSVDKKTVVRLDYRVTETALDNKNIFQQIVGSIGGPSASNVGL
ncbi:MAG: outer membrane protein assembly factor BamE [Rhodobacterales bacterium]|nr:outer membrane protein assembly factor BamE [Rhodobacterales bacterium]